MEIQNNKENFCNQFETYIKEEGNEKLTQKIEKRSSLVDDAFGYS